jgi:hypothetical protein
VHIFKLLLSTVVAVITIQIEDVSDFKSSEVLVFLVQC